MTHIGFRALRFGLALAGFVAIVAPLTAEDPQAGALFLAQPYARAMMDDYARPCLAAVQKDVVPLMMKATKITFFALTTEDSPKGVDVPISDRFHGWKILGETTISKPEELAAWKTKLVGYTAPGAAITSVFPQYGMRFETPGGPLEIVACFETHQWMLFSDAVEKDSLARGAMFDEPVRKSLHLLFDSLKIPRSADGRGK